MTESPAASEKSAPSPVPRNDAALHSFAAFADAGRFFLFALKRFHANQTLRVAASLSYTSLLAIVPLMAIGLAMLAAFPAFSEARGQIEGFVFENFVPQAGDVVQGLVRRFVDAAGGLTAIGIVFLGITAVMMLVTIEDALNTIFRVREKRAFASRLMVYWTILTLGPVLIGASFSLAGYFYALSHWAGERGLGAALGLFSNAIPILLATSAFCLIYAVVPNRRISLRAALIGGLCAGVMFGALRYGFTVYVTNAKTYQTIYGALATLPIFMLWTYLSWAVVLFGAEIAAAVPEWRAHRGRAVISSGAGATLRAALEAIALLREESRRGRGLSRDRLLKKTALPEDVIAPVMERLEETGFIARTTKGTWVVARDLELTRLYELVGALGLGFTAEAEDAGDAGGEDAAWRGELARRVTAAGSAERQALDLPISALLGPS